MNHLRIIVTAFFLSILIGCLSGCKEKESEPNISKLPGGTSDVEILKSTNEQEREKEAEAIREKQQQMIHQLIRLAEQNVQPVTSRTTEDSEYIRHHAKHLAILLLGDIRATEAIPVLLDNLNYRNPNILVGGSYMELGKLYVAAEALSKIGMPAVGPVIDKLGIYSEQEESHSICCWIIREILGPRLGKVRIEMAIEETKDETVKKNLTAALPYFKTQQEKNAEERARREKASKQEPSSKTEK